MESNCAVQCGHWFHPANHGCLGAAVRAAASTAFPGSPRSPGREDRAPTSARNTADEYIAAIRKPQYSSHSLLGGVATRRLSSHRGKPLEGMTHGSDRAAAVVVRDHYTECGYAAGQSPVALDHGDCNGTGRLSDLRVNGVTSRTQIVATGRQVPCLQLCPVNRKEVMAAVNPHQSPAGPGPARQGFARSAGISEGVSWPNPSIRTRPAGDLFQPVPSSKPHPAAPTVKAVTPVDGPLQGGELVSAPTPQSRCASGARRWVGRGDGLMFKMPGTVIALVASAALVLVLTGVTVFTTSLSTESPAVGLTLDQLPAPVTPVISDGHPATVPAINAPAEPAGQTPAEASSLDPSPVAAHQQHVPAAHRLVSAPPTQTPPASDHGPVVPPPSSTVTTDEVRSRTVTTNSHTANTKSRTTNTDPCDCDDTTREAPTDGDRPPKADHRGPQAQQPGNPQRARSNNPGPASKEKASKEKRTQKARPDAASGTRPSPAQPRRPDPGSTQPDNEKQPTYQ